MKNKKNKIKLVHRLDDMLFKMISYRVKKWIKKNKYKYHKYYWYKRLIKIQTILFFVTMILLVPIGFYLKEASKISFFIHSLTCIVFIFSLWQDFKFNDWFSKEWDFVWENRKIPQVYKYAKELCKLIHEKGRDMRCKFLRCSIIMLVFLFAVMPLLIMSNGLGLDDFMFVFLMAFVIINILTLYMVSIFDLDPPRRRKKKAVVDEKLSELMQGVWDKVIEGFKPKIPVRVRN